MSAGFGLRQSSGALESRNSPKSSYNPNMKCSPHQKDAVAVCVYCGRALCAECVRPALGVRTACSTECAEALANGDKALRTILHQSVQTTRASAFYCYICGGLSLSAAIIAWFMLPSPFLILFTASCGIVLIIAGAWYGQVAQRKES